MRMILKREDIEHPSGLEISVEGYKGDIGGKVPTQVFIEVYEGELKVHVWDGEEDPKVTVTIPPEVPKHESQ